MSDRSSGKSAALTATSLMLSPAYSSFSFAKTRRCASSWENARTRRAAAAFSCTTAEMSAILACTFSDRRKIFSPSTFIRMETTGITPRVMSVSRGLIASMKAKQPTVVTTVSTGYITPGPSTIRTAFMSWALRESRSPTR